jgi:hypothetical protein
MGVQFIVVPNRNAPSAFSGEDRPPPPSLLDALAEQLDLAPIESDVSLVVYRNTAYRGPVTLPPEGAAVGDRFTDAAADDLASFEAARLERTDRTSWQGRLTGRGPVLMAERASDGWELRIRGRAEDERGTGYGWAQRFEAGSIGATRLTHSSPSWYPVLLGAQVLLWIAAFVFVRRTSPRRARRRAAAAPTAPTGSGP